MRILLFSTCLFMAVSLFSQKSKLTIPGNSAVKWAVDDYVLSQKTGQLPMPDVKPEYEFGKKGLLNFFNDEVFESDVNTVISIQFIVSKEGKAHTFELLSKHTGENHMIADEFLTMIPHLPASWLPAKVRGTYVDCYEVMNIYITNGEVEKITLK